MTERPKLPGGNMTVRKAEQRWADVYAAARDGDPDRMLTAAQKFEGIAATMFMTWSAGFPLSPQGQEADTPPQDA